MVIDSVFSYFDKNNQLIDREWLIVGKGSSFSLFSSLEHIDCCLFTLNDSIREVNHATIAHFIDFEAFLRCKSYIDSSDIVVLPRFPHFSNKPGGSSLQDLIYSDDKLKQLVQEQRLYQYDLSSSPRIDKKRPIITATFFSSEAALEILSKSGIRKIRTIGVDGGNSYDEHFSDLKSISLLSNGQSTFDKQFEIFANNIFKYGLDFGPINMQLPVQIFIAATKSEELAVRVLEYSIRKTASVSVKITALCDTGIIIPEPVNPRNKARTPFSFQRFTIPQACSYKGKAIYLDSDMLVFKDIVSIWKRSFDEQDVLTTYADSKTGRIPQYSVMLINCESLSWNIKEIINQLDSGSLTYEQLMHDFSLAKADAILEPEWNSLESYKVDKTALLHYTDMHTQPWISSVNPLAYLWVNTLRNAIKDGFISRDLLLREIEMGHVRPSLLYQIDNEIDDPILLPRIVLNQDLEFVAPYTSIAKHNGSPWKSWPRMLRAKLRSIFLTTFLYRMIHSVLKRLSISDR